MNMQYAQAVVAHEQAQLRRLDAGPTAMGQAPRPGPRYGGPPRHSSK
jgi:hypothetical protein